MTNCKQTKRALLSSVLALLLCFTMLLGTTFAWFTDTASTSVNTIQAGTLDVALEMKDGDKWVSAEGKTLSFTNNYWEPGCTYALPELRIVNNGNLSLKYKVVITGIKGDAKLNEAIEWTINGMVMDHEYTLNAEATQNFTISGHMKENAGNEYQGKKIEGISITVYATQATVEVDGTGSNQYDKDAEYQINNGSTTITGDVTLNGTYIATTDNGNVAGDKNAVRITSGTVTITGGYYDGTSGGNNAAVRADDGATVIIKDGYFTVGTDANGNGNNVIYAAGGNITIEGGTFYTEYSYDGRYFTLNCNDKDNYGGSITVKGGKFYKFNPAEASTKGTTSYVGNKEVTVADGYKVIHAGDWYYVVANDATSMTVDTLDGLKAAIANKMTTIDLAANIELDGQIEFGTVTINGNGYSLTNAPVRVGTGSTINNVVFNNPVSKYNQASNLYCSGSLTVNNCTFKNTQWDAIQVTPAAGDTVTINGCSFTANSSGAQRFIHIEVDNGSACTANVTTNITNNNFGSSSVMKNDIIGIYGVAESSINYGGNNTFADQNGAVWIGWASNAYANNQNEVYAKLTGSNN